VIVQLDRIYVVSLGLLVGLVTIPMRDLITKRLAARGAKIHSFLWGWFAMLFSMISVIPVLIARGATLDWGLLSYAYTEGLPVGAVAIVAYDLGIKPLKQFGSILVDTVTRWIITEEKGVRTYGMAENELEDMSHSPGYPRPDCGYSNEQNLEPKDPDGSA
jgi:hypothetical protein